VGRCERGKVKKWESVKVKERRKAKQKRNSESRNKFETAKDEIKEETLNSKSMTAGMQAKI
jgi:hypothetical protein